MYGAQARCTFRYNVFLEVAKVRQLQLMCVLFSLWVSGSWAGELTMPMVQNVIQAVEAAAIQQNPQALASIMADNVDIQLNINMLGQNKVVKPNKKEYIEVISEAWSRFKGYHYQRSNTDINLAGDYAVVHASVHESMVINGRKVAGTSKEQVTIRLVGGQPKITQVIGSSGL